MLYDKTFCTCIDIIYIYICTAGTIETHYSSMCFSPLYKLLRISPLQLTRTIVYCASRIIVFPTLSTVYISVHYSFRHFSLLSRVTIFLFSLFKISSFQFPSPVTPFNHAPNPPQSLGYRGRPYRCRSCSICWANITSFPKLAYNVPSFSNSQNILSLANNHK